MHGWPWSCCSSLLLVLLPVRKKKNRSEQKGRYFLSGSATEGQQIISQIITSQCKHGHLRTYAWARMFPKVCVGGKCCRKVLHHVCSFIRRFDQNTKQALIKIEMILSVSPPKTIHKTSFVSFYFQSLKSQGKIVGFVSFKYRKNNVQRRSLLVVFSSADFSVYIYISLVKNIDILIKYRY